MRAKLPTWKAIFCFNIARFRDGMAKKALQNHCLQLHNPSSKIPNLWWWLAFSHKIIQLFLQTRSKSSTTFFRFIPRFCMWNVNIMVCWQRPMHSYYPLQFEWRKGTKLTMHAVVLFSACPTSDRPRISPPTPRYLPSIHARRFLINWKSTRLMVTWL